MASSSSADKGKGKATVDDTPTSLSIANIAAELDRLRAENAALKNNPPPANPPTESTPAAKKKRRTKAEVQAAKAEKEAKKQERLLKKAEKSGTSTGGSGGAGSNATVDNRTVEEKLVDYDPPTKEYAPHELRKLKSEALRKYKDFPYIRCMEAGTLSHTMLAGYIGYKSTIQLYEWLNSDQPGGGCKWCPY